MTIYLELDSYLFQVDLPLNLKILHLLFFHAKFSHDINIVYL